MADLVKPEVIGRAVSKFDPKTTRRKDAVLGYAIEEARKIKDWPALEKAVELKMEEQQAFVAWWRASVTPREKNRGGKLNAAPGSVSKETAEGETGIKQQQVSKWTRRLEHPDQYRGMLYGAAYAKAMAEENSLIASMYTGDFEWYTPEKYIEAARKVLGAIDLDPASSAFAQKVVRAGAWYSEKDDGLKQEWHGRIFLNPPYKYPLVEQFGSKLLAEIDAGNVSSAIFLTNNTAEAKWWHQVASRATAVCFTLGRISFYKEEGEKTQPTDGQSFCYFGDRRDQFAEIFSAFGLTMIPVRAA